MTIVIVMLATIAIVLGLCFLYWITNLIIKKSGRLKGKNEEPLTQGKNLIFKTIFFGLYLFFIVCLGFLTDKETGQDYLFTKLWYQLVLFALPSIVFWLWFLTEYVYIIYLKCKVGEKELINSNPTNKVVKIVTDKDVKITSTKTAKNKK